MKLPNFYVTRTLGSVIKTVTSRDGLKQLWGVRLYSNAFYLMMTSGISSLLGFFFWIIVARLYSPEDVGLASALIAVVALLAGFTHLGLDVALIRFLSHAGKEANLMINTTLTIITITSVIGASIFVLGLDFWSPALIFIRQSPIYLAAFFLFTIAFNASSLQDRTLIAERRAGYTVAKSLIFGLLKLPLTILLAAFLHFFGIFISWGTSLMVSFLVGTFLFFPRIRPDYQPSFAISKKLVKELMHFSLTNYIADFFWSASATVLPILVLNRLGAESTAYFSIAWAIASSTVMISGAVSTALFAEGSHDEDRLEFNVWRSIKIISLTLVPIIILMLIIGGKLLLFFGESYSVNGLSLLRIVAISALPWSINLVYLSKLRVQKKLKLIIIFTICISVLTLGLTFLFLPWMGINGAGIAWLITHGIIAIIIAVTSHVDRKIVASVKALISRNKE